MCDRQEELGPFAKYSIRATSYSIPCTVIRLRPAHVPPRQCTCSLLEAIVFGWEKRQASRPETSQKSLNKSKVWNIVMTQLSSSASCRSPILLNLRYHNLTLAHRAARSYHAATAMSPSNNSFAIGRSLGFERCNDNI